MKSFKKIARLSGLVLLIVLASVGMGLVGGAPIPRSNKKEHPIELSVDGNESEEEESKLAQFDMKQ